MNTERRDATVMAWLEDGPSRLPHTARRAIQAGIRTTRQERGWRGGVARLIGGLRLDQLAPAGATVVLVVLTVVALVLLTRPGGPGGPGPTSPTPSPTPSASPFLSLAPSASWPTFTSERHGYSIRHPADWVVTPATEPWPFGSGIAGGPGNPEALDRFNSDRSTSRILATSQRLPVGMSEGEWIEGYRAPVVQAFGEQCFPPPERWARQTIDGVVVGVYVGCQFVEAMAFAGGRAYTFTLDDTFTTADPSARPLYDEMLLTVTFHPETADDTPVGGTPAP